MATDKELNSYTSLRKLAPYREGDAKQGSKKKRLRELRSALGKRKWGEDLPGKDGEVDLEKYTKRRRENQAKAVEGRKAAVAATGEEAKPKKRLGKKERKRLQAEAAGGSTAPAVV